MLIWQLFAAFAEKNKVDLPRIILFHQHTYKSVSALIVKTENRNVSCPHVLILKNIRFVKRNFFLLYPKMCLHQSEAESIKLFLNAILIFRNMKMQLN